MKHVNSKAILEMRVTPKQREQWRADDEARREQPSGSIVPLPKQPPVSTEQATSSLAQALAKWAVTAGKVEGQSV